MTVTLLVIVTETLLVTRILKVTVTETDGDSMFVVYRQFVTIDLVKLPSLPRVSHSRNMCCCVGIHQVTSWLLLVRSSWMENWWSSCGHAVNCRISVQFLSYFVGHTLWVDANFVFHNIGKQGRQNEEDFFCMSLDAFQRNYPWYAPALGAFFCHRSLLQTFSSYFSARVTL